MPEPLSLQQFKARLASQEARRALGLTLTDEEALRVVVDDQKVADLYVAWRTHPRAEVPPPAEAAPVPFLRRPTTWLLGAVGVIAIVVGGVFLANALVDQSGQQRYLELVRNNPAIKLREEAFEDGLANSYRVNCDKVRDGWTSADQFAAAQRNWEGAKDLSEVSKEQYIANTMGLFRAAEEVCG